MVKIRKQLKWPLPNEWIKMLWFVYTMEYYSAIKKNAPIPLAATWVDLEFSI